MIWLRTVPCFCANFLTSGFVVDLPSPLVMSSPSPRQPPIDTTHEQHTLVHACYTPVSSCFLDLNFPEIFEMIH